jgi:hypothetical protein
MWLYLFAGILGVVGVVGSLAGGGIFTIWLLPLAVVVAGFTLFSGMWGRSEEGSAGQSQPAADRPLPHAHTRPSGRVPDSPERLADARRAEQ